MPKKVPQKAQKKLLKARKGGLPLPSPAYYGLIRELPATDQRLPKLLKQLEERGFDDTETWSLFTTIVAFILPRLERFREITIAYPMDMTEAAWSKALEKMIVAFRLVLEYDKTHDVWTNPKKSKQAKEGLDLFHRHFLSLWW